MRGSNFVSCVLVFLFLSQMSAAQEWSAIANPSPRANASMVYDAMNERMVMFGGNDLSLEWGGAHNDVWVLDLVVGSEAWQPLSPAGTPPSPRFQTSAVYDSAGQRMIIFGGTSDFTDRFNEVWILILEAGNERWEKMQISGTSPSSRSHASAINDDANQRMVMFGGYDAQECLNDLWSLDLVSSTWNSLTPAGVPPSPRHGHTAVYDPLELRMVVFGGKDDVQVHDDVYVLGLTPGNEEWTQLSASGESPEEVCGHLAVYDAALSRMYSYGGFRYPPFTYPEDVFYLDLTAREWTRISLHPAPPARRALCGALDPGNRRLIVFGGNRWPDYYFGDTHTLTIPSTGMSEQEWSVSSLFVTDPAPNPSAASSSILFYLEDPRRVKVAIYNALGAHVKTLLDCEARQGWHSVTWAAKDESGNAVSSGQYFYRIEAGEYRATKKMVLVR